MKTMQVCSHKKSRILLKMRLFYILKYKTYPIPKRENLLTVKSLSVDFR